MGIFSGYITNKSGSIVTNDSLESIMEDSNIDIDNISEDYEYEGNEIITTMNENYNMIMTNIGITEASHFDRYGTEMVYTEGVLSSFVNVIKNFLKKIWEKIKGLFKRFTLMIDKYTMEDKAFVKKYRKQLFTGKNLDDMKFKGYVYTIDDNKIDDGLIMCTGTAEDARELAGKARENFSNDKMNEEYDNMLEKLRGEILSKMGGQAGSYSQEEFTKEVKELLRNKESEKEELDKIDIYKITNEMMSAKDTKKKLDTMFKTSKKIIDKEEKEIERAQNEFLKKQPYGAGEENKDSGHLDHDAIERALKNLSTKYPGGVAIKHGELVNSNSPNKEYVINFNPDNDDDLRILWDRYIKKTVPQKYQISYDEITPEGKADLRRQVKAIRNYGSTLNIGSNFSVQSDTVAMKVKNYHLTNKQYSERAAREFNYFLRKVRDTKTIMLSIQTAVMAALKERSRQNKAICVKVIHYNPKEESYNESYSSTYTNISSGFLSNVELK